MPGPPALNHLPDLVICLQGSFATIYGAPTLCQNVPISLLKSLLTVAGVGQHYRCSELQQVKGLSKGAGLWQRIQTWVWLPLPALE